MKFNKWTLGLCLIGMLAITSTGCQSVRDTVPATQISGSLGNKPFSITAPKDVSIEHFKASVETNGTVSVEINNLNAKVNPDVITTSGDAQAKITEAQGNAFVKAFQAGGQAAGAAIGAAAKTP